MVNIEQLKREIHKSEKRKVFVKMFLFNFVIMIFLMISMSGVGQRQKEHNLLLEKHQVEVENDSLRSIILNDLKLLKQRENDIMRSVLSLSFDTTYNELNPGTYDINNLLSEQQESFNLLNEVTEHHWDSINRIPMGSPISSADLYRISDDYGWRKHPVLKKWIFHEGVDFSAETGMDIVATAGGVIEWVIKSNHGYGNRVVINHGYGYKTVYAHMSKFNVKNGQFVNRGDVIGYVGNTGRSTGPHLHYEVLLNNRPVNPNEYFVDYLASK